MKKRTHFSQRVLALLLCLCMMLSTFPAAFAADTIADDPAAEGVPPLDSSMSEESNEPLIKMEESADTLSSTVEFDGAAMDTWTQTPATKFGTDSVCKKENGKLSLAAGTGNGNNAGAKPSGVSKPLPAMFVDAEMSAALAAAEGEKTISFKMTPNSTTDNICFGVFLNYAEPANSDTAVYGLGIIYNTIGGWNAQHYFGTADIYPTISGLPKLEKGTEYAFEIKWTDSAVTSIKVNDAAGTISDTGANFTDVTVSLGVIDKVGFKMGKDPQTSGITSAVLTNVNYTGQPEAVTSYSVGGTVKTSESGNAPIADATVKIGETTYTANASGVWATAATFLPGTYTATISATGYHTATGSITVAAADIADADFTLIPGSMLQADGAVADTWTQSEVTVKGTDAVCEKVGGVLHLKGGSLNANGRTPADFPATFVNTEATAMIATAGDGPKFVEFTLTPLTEGVKNRAGIFINYTDPGDAFFIGFDALGWFWENYKDDAGAGYYSGARVAAPGKDTEAKVRIEWNGTTLTKATVNGTNMFPSLPLNFSAASNAAPNVIAFKVGTFAASVKEISDVNISDLHYTGQPYDQQGYTIGGTITSTAVGADVPTAAVRIDGKTYVTNASGVYTTGQDYFLPGTYTAEISAENFVSKEIQVTITDADITDASTAITPIEVNTATLTTNDMTVLVDAEFPRVIEYNTVATDAKASQKFYGQTKKLDKIRINGVDIVPTVTANVENAATGVITYDILAVDEAKNIDCTIHANLTAVGKTLTFNITGVTYTDPATRIAHPVQSIMVPEHSLISVRSTQPGANFKGARLAASTISSGDSYMDVTTGNVSNLNDQRYFLGFVSNDELSAGLASNSDWGTGSAGSGNYPVLVSAEDRGTFKTLGLGSTLWYYDRKVSDSDPSPMMNRDIPNDSELSIVPVRASQLPLFAAVSIGGEANNDGAVDWQDGAILYRDTILHKPANSDTMPDVVSTRIAMNFGSQAQNPFLTNLDNAKRLALHTDGLGQAILLKGYGSEGHDSGHPDFADVGARMGGAKDFRTMAKEGKEIGAHFGIHINTSEFYPEARAFSEEMVYRHDNNGTNLGSMRYGWNWIDQGIGINGIYDLTTGNREKRLDALHALVGDYGDEKGGLDFIYVDVWGNNTSGKEDSWQTRKLSQQIIENGWRIAHEWSYGNPYESTFQHWTADFGYGDYADKGKLNSEVIRFLLNDRKDSFPADFAWYGGAANAPLLGGPSMQGFEGWQGDGEYNLASYNVFNQMIPTKFLQHFDVVDWTNAEEATALPYSTTGGGAQSNTSNWIPESQITLTSPEGDEVVVTRGADGNPETVYPYGTAAEKVAYRSRYMTLNGKVIAEGAPQAGDFKLPVAATMKYLIPWNWVTGGADEGKPVAAADEKMYHWNAVGGNSTWELPDDWKTLANVTMYELTETGRDTENAKTVTVSNGEITLTATKDTPYIVVKGEAASASAGPQITFTAPGTHLTDVSFNAHTLADGLWATTDDTASIYRTDKNVPMLKFSGEGSVKQPLVDLKPGTEYAVYVGVDNRSDAKASITVDVNGAELATNYTNKSFARNYISAYNHSMLHPVENGTSLFQNMYVFFTAPASGTTTLTLSREDGVGNTYFDDVRVVERLLPEKVGQDLPSTSLPNFTYNADGSFKAFWQDFENVAQGQYPFVVGPTENVADNRQHLSERHAPYTQAGWDVKKLDDVIDGNWSLKVNGLCSRQEWDNDRKDTNGNPSPGPVDKYHAALTFHTIPQNFRFEPGKTYDIAFDYQMGSAGTYEVVIGTGNYDANAVTVVPLKEALGNADGSCKTQTARFTVVGDPTGQTWFGIRSTRVFADYDPTDGVIQTPTSASAPINSSEQNFGGYKEIVLDNLSIVPSTMDKGPLTTLIATATGMKEADYTGDWAAFTTALNEAEAVLAKLDATQDELTAATTKLDTAIKALTKLVTTITGTVKVGTTPIVGATVSLQQGAQYLPTGNTAVTGADGTYTLTGLSAGSYTLRVSAPGYNVQTVASFAAAANASTIKDVVLVAQTAAPYVNNFDNGDVSMMKPLERDQVKLTPKAVEQGGSGAVEISGFNGGDPRGNMLDMQSPLMKNGTVEMDLTYMGALGKRVGPSLRGSETGDLWVGSFEDGFTYSYQAYGPLGNGYGGSANGPALANGVTRHFKLTLDETTTTLDIDGIRVFSINKATGIVAPGHVGVSGARNTGKIIMDNLRVTSADAAVADTFTVGGTIKVGDVPLAGASVVVKKGTAVVTRTTTGADGTYVTIPLAAGTYTVEASAPGYTANTAEAVVSNVNITNADIAIVKTAYAVTVTTPAENTGTLSSNPTSAGIGDLVTLTATPASGYQLKKLTVTGASGAVKTTLTETANVYTFTMPGEIVTVAAVFEKIPNAIAVTPSQNGTVVANKQTAGAGDIVTLTVTPNAYYRMKAGTLTVTDHTRAAVVTTPVDGKFTFVMPAVAVTVTAEFEKVTSAVTVTPPTASTGTLTATPNGDVESGTLVTIVAIPASGYVKGTVTVTGTSGKTYTAAPAEAANTYTFNMPIEPVTVAAVFKVEPHAITIGALTNGTVTATVAGVAATEAGVGTTVTLTATPDAHYRVKQGTVTVTGASGTVAVTPGATNVYTFTMPSEAVTVAAVFEKIPYGITIASGITNGTLESDKQTAGIGDLVTLTPAAASGYVVNTVTVTGASGTVATTPANGKYTFVMPGEAVTATATFVTEPHAINIATFTGGAVTATVGDAAATEASVGDTVALTATPATGYRVTSVTVTSAGGAVETTVVNGKYTFTMPGVAVTVAAVFEKIAYTVIVTPPTNGTVTSDKQTATMGDLVTLTITPDANYAYTLAITGDPAVTPIAGTNKVTFVMPANNVTVTATFAKVTSAVNIAPGITGGTVTTDKATALSGDTVTLTATPNGDHEFESITVTTASGAVVETTLVDGKYTFTMPLEAVTVTAAFSEVSTGNTERPSKPVTSENEDGSTTKTVTDKRTGTVTATTTDKSGNKSVVETKKDGTTTATVQIPKSAEGKVTVTMPELPIDNATVTVKSDKKVTVTIPVKDAATGTVVLLVNADGTETILPKSFAGDGTLSVVLDGDATLKLKDNTKTFVDVAKDNWAAEAVGFVASRELFNGVSKTEFAPTTPMSRAMLVTVLYRLESKPEAGENTFDDVDADTWFTPAVAWAAESEIVTGTGTGFNPNGNITRESLALTLYRYATKLGLETKADGMAVSEFTDSDKVSDWAADAMNWAVATGIISGKDGNRLAPDGDASRAEVSIMLERFVKLL